MFLMSIVRLSSFSEPDLLNYLGVITLVQPSTFGLSPHFVTGTQLVTNLQERLTREDGPLTMYVCMFDAYKSGSALSSMEGL